MSDPISPYRAGGWPNEHNPWGRWENNGTGKLFETAADGSWLDNGDYERAYKGFPSYKQVNLFVGGGTYFAPSWETTLDLYTSQETNLFYFFFFFEYNDKSCPAFI